MIEDRDRKLADIFGESLELYESFYSTNDTSIERAEEKYYNAKLSGEQKDSLKAMRFLKETHQDLRKKEKIKSILTAKAPLLALVIALPILIASFGLGGQLITLSMLGPIIGLQQVFSRENAKEKSFEVQSKKLSGAFAARLKK